MGEKRRCDVEQQPQAGGTSLFCLPAIVRHVFLPPEINQPEPGDGSKQNPPTERCSFPAVPRENSAKRTARSTLATPVRFSVKRGAAVRPAWPEPTPTPHPTPLPPFPQQGGLKRLTGSSCVAVDIWQRVFPPDSRLRDRFTGTSETLNALSLPCRRPLLHQFFF